MAEYTFESPTDLVKHLYAGEDTPTGICGRPSALFGWYTIAKRFYDESLCKSCRPKYTDQQMESMYAEILKYPSQEKQNALLAVGGDFTLKLRGDVLGRVAADE
jgi:hypothetical protein